MLTHACGQSAQSNPEHADDCKAVTDLIAPMQDAGCQSGYNRPGAGTGKRGLGGDANRYTAAKAPLGMQTRHAVS